MKNMIKYSFCQGFMWMLYASTFAYVTPYLLGEEFSVAQIGIITALFSIIAAFIQPVSGRLVDKKKFTWSTLVIFLMAVNILSSVLLFIIKIKILQGICFGLTLICTSVSVPMINRAGFICNRKDEKIDFGIARGIGSLSYALLTFILGKTTVNLGMKSVPAATFLVSLMLILSVLLLKSGNLPENNSENQTLKSTEKSGNKKNIFDFIKTHPEFFAVWFACILQMTFHNIYGTYFINICEKAGGNSETMGTALSIAAVCELPVMFSFTLIYKKIKSKNLLLISAVFFILKGVAFLFARNTGAIYLAQVLQCMSFAIFANASVFYAEENMAEEYKTTAQAFMSGSPTIGAVLGSLTGGFIIEKINVNASLIFGIIITVLSALILCICEITEICRKNTRSR